MRVLIMMLLFFFLFSCNFFSKQEDKKDESFFNTEEKRDTLIISKKTENSVSIDTVSLQIFWSDFQNDLRHNNRKKIIETLEYPVRAIFPVLFRYAHDCDTLTYIKNEKKYADFDIDRTNINEYYDFIFTDVLKEVVYQTSVDDLLSKGIIHKNNIGMTYQFYPKDYNIKVHCPNDHLLMFYITYKNDKWNIDIGGL